MLAGMQLISACGPRTASPGPSAASPAPGAAASPSAVAGERPPTFRVGLIPNIAPDRQRALYEPFREYLAKALNQPVETFVATDYAGVVEAMASDKIDLAYFGGLTYVQAELRADVYPIVTEIDRETNTEKYYSAIIVRSDSPYQKVEDIKGKKFAFGDISSTSGSLYPRLMLDKAGFSNFTDPQTYVYTGGHDATLAAVINGSVEGGGLEKRIMERAFDAGTYDKDQIRIVEQTLVQGYPWVVRAKLDPSLVNDVTNAFLNISDPQLLQLMRAVKYARVTKGDYDEVRREADRLGLRRA
jgi:phosphonate transport system substrate-binding protein